MQTVLDTRAATKGLRLKLHIVVKKVELGLISLPTSNTFIYAFADY